MFKRIVVSVPQEQFPELALKRGKYLTDILGSKLFLSYIIEENVFDEVSSGSRHVLTEKDKIKFERSMTRTHERVAKKIIMKEARKILKNEPDDFTINKGRFTDAVLREIGQKEADTLLMEYESYNLMKFRIMDHSPVPVWIERHDGPIKKIGLFCTNLSPNKRAPRAAAELKRACNARIHAYYINDPKGKIDEDEPDHIGRTCRIKWTDIVNDKVDHFIYQKAKEEEFDLIILGRIRKRGYFHMRSKFAKKTKCSVLLVN